MAKSLKGVEMLITAGPVWVAIDKVRVITNIFSGNLGVAIATEAYRQRAVVTLLMGPGRAILPKIQSTRFRVVSFRYYDDLLRLVQGELKKKDYDVMIHSAAVSDYKPKISKEKKIKSGKKNLSIPLIPTIKIVDLIKKIRPKIFLVKFKLEVELPEKKLVDAAYQSMKKSKADLIVANDFKTVTESPTDHKVFVIDNDRKIVTATGKENIAKKILQEVSARLT